MKKVLIAGAGFFGSVLAERLSSQHFCGVTILERRGHIGGNCWSEIDMATGVEYHAYGSHIFHTSDERVWNYVTAFSPFNDYRHTVWTVSRGRIFPMPISLATINGYYMRNLTPEQAKEFIAQEIAKEASDNSPANLEEKAVSLIGRPLYEAFIKGYTIKQWEKDPKELAADIITRLPVRYNYNTRYFSDTFEGIPTDGYGRLFSRMLTHHNIDIRLNTPFQPFYAHNKDYYDLIIYTGAIDEFFDYQLGALEWRTVDFEVERHDCDDVQGTSVVNYADSNVPHTRIHEFKHYHPERKNTGKSITFTEYSRSSRAGDEPYYPVPTAENTRLLRGYQELAQKQAPHVIFGGRLGSYRYYDMDDTIAAAFQCLDNRIVPLLRNKQACTPQD